MYVHCDEKLLRVEFFEMLHETNKTYDLSYIFTCMIITAIEDAKNVIQQKDKSIFTGLISHYFLVTV